MDEAVYYALKGKTWAMNDVIDGLYNGRNGFPKDPALAATLIQEFTAPLEGKPLAELSKANQDLLLKLAYMQFNPEHGKLGVEFNPLHGDCRKTGGVAGPVPRNSRRPSRSSNLKKLREPPKKFPVRSRRTHRISSRSSIAIRN